METNMMRSYFMRTSPHVTKDSVEEWLYLPRISCGLKARRHRSASTPASRHSKLDILLFGGSARSGVKQINWDEGSLVSAEKLRRSGEKLIQ